MDKIDSMRVFVRVADLGSFAAAAKALDMSPTMAAKHVQEIESRLGARLIHRTTRRQSLTEVGRIYLERSKGLLVDFDATESSASEQQAEPRGLLRVTAPVGLGTHGIAPLLGEFMALCPQVSVELALTDRVVDLVAEGFDVALRSGPLPDSGFVARPLAPLRMLLCAAPAYLRKHGTPRHPADLSKHECLGSAHGAYKDRWRLIGPAGEERVPVKGRLQINNGDALRQAALSGAGILMHAELLLAADLAAKRLVRVLPKHAPPFREAHLVYLPDRHPRPKLQRFVDFVLERLGPGRTRRT